MKIGTHDGPFQADDVLAVAILLAVDDDDYKIIRTRDPEMLRDCDVVVDVGGVYDHAARRYDHHQRGGAGARPNGIQYSSAGLVWLHYGNEYLGEVESTKRRERIWEEIDRAIVAPIDAIDNGQRLYNEPVFEDIHPYSMSAVIGSMNPTWMQQDPKQFLDRFVLAVSTTGYLLQAACGSVVGRLEAEDGVRSAIKLSENPHVIELPVFMPWQKVVINDAPNALFVIFPDASGYKLQAIPAGKAAFESRALLPATWAGLESTKLVAVTGVQDAVFCHRGRFIAGARSLEGIRALARLALQEL